MTKRTLLTAATALSLLALCGCQTPANGLATAQRQPSPEELDAMRQTCQFLKEAGHYFIATTDHDQPRVRPFGTVNLFENRLYIQTGRRKNVARQLLANGKVELCALKGDRWIRISGILVDDNRREPKQAMLDAYPNLKAMYSPDDDNTMVLFFRPGSVTVTIHSFKDKPVTLNF